MIGQHIFRRDGIDLALHVEDGEGPLFFFQHGLCGDVTQPRAVYPQGAGVRLAVLECRGHGASQSGSASHFAIATFADDVAAAISELSSGPCVVGGISMGAAIALRIACLRPDLVSALVVARPAWLFEAAPDSMQPNLAVGRQLLCPLAADEVMDFLSSETGKMLATHSPDNLASLLGFFQRQPRQLTAELLTRIPLDGPGITATDLARLAIPSLVIGNAEDVIHPLSYARTIAAAIPCARFVEIPPKSHGRPAHEAAFRVELRRFLLETQA